MSGRRGARPGEVGQRPWREDPDILKRVEQVWDLSAEGNKPPLIATQLGIALSTVYEDLDRYVELYQERAESKVAERVSNLEALKRRILRQLQSTGSQSLNVGQLLNLLRQVEMDIAKLEGSLVERKEVKGEVTLRDLVAGFMEEKE